MSPAKPYELARLAHLYLRLGNKELAHNCLDLSIETGPHIRPLYYTRLLTLEGIWEGLRFIEKSRYIPLIRAGFRYRQDLFIIAAKRSRAFRVMATYGLLNDLPLLTEFFNLLRKP